MTSYSNCATDICNALSEKGVDTTEVHKTIVSILQKNFPSSSVSGNTDNQQQVLMQNMLALLTGNKPAKQSKRKGVVTMPKPTIAQKEIFDHAGFIAGVKAGTITPAKIFYSADHKSKAGEEIPVGWTHFVKHVHAKWVRIKDIPEVDKALEQRQTQYKAWREGHPEAKSNKNGSLYDQFVRDPDTPAFEVPAQAKAVLA